MITLDINPRVLVASMASEILTTLEEARSYPDAIFVPVRENSSNLPELLSTLPDVEIPIFVLPSSGQEDCLNGDTRKNTELLGMDDARFESVLQRMYCNSNRMCVSYFDAWDLPAKRNYAIWFARTNCMNRILLLDDDIRGLNENALVAGANALEEFLISGYFVDDFPDTSVIGHAEIEAGLTVHTFLSGSCLFIRTDCEVGLFPPIYNEDWLFMIPQMALGRVCSLGSISQKEYDPFANALTAAFQEPGEVIAEGLMALLASGQYDQRFDHQTWRILLSLHCSNLEDLLRYPLDIRLKAAVEAARGKCSELTIMDCVRFLTDWEADQRMWESALKELH